MIMKRKINITFPTISIGSNRSQSSPKPVARISPVSSIRSQLNNRPSPLENVRISFLCATRTRIVHLEKLDRYIYSSSEIQSYRF
jgi:hypothetical protein